MLTSSKTKDWHKWLEGIKYENETKIWLPHVGEMHRHIPTFNLEELIQNFSRLFLSVKMEHIIQNDVR